MNDSSKDAKLKIKLGDHAFEFEGDAAMAQGMYEAFLAALKSSAAAPAAPAQTPTATPAPVQEQLNDGKGALTPAPTPAPNPFQEMMTPLARVFVERDGVISLQALPKTENPEGDALVLLLYGYQELKSSEYPVTGVRMMQAAKLSGVKVDRIDRTFDGQTQYVLTAGQRRGKRYQLNNLGIVRAKEIIGALFG
jgi:hypothetical protein